MSFEKGDADLLIIQNRLVERMMQLYDADLEETHKLRKTRRGNVEGIIEGISSQVTPFLDALESQASDLEELEREAARTRYYNMASILVEMIPLLADAITLRLRIGGSPQ